jgi:hypothetical protein
MVDAEQYRKVLEEWIYPPVHSVQVIHCPLPSNSAKCLVAIHVPPAATHDKPYVVTKSVPGNGLTRGTMIGYYERVQDRIPPTSPETIRTRLRDGMRFGEVSQRLDSIQSVITNLSSSPKPKPEGLTLNFLILATEVYKYAELKPDNLRILLSLNNMNVDGLSATLSPIPDMRERPTITERAAPSDAMSIWVNAPFKDIDLGSVAYELLGRFYTKFGFNYDEMPYVQKNKQGNRITPDSLMGKYKEE